MGDASCTRVTAKFDPEALGRSLVPLVKTRDFGMTPDESHSSIFRTTPLVGPGGA